MGEFVLTILDVAHPIRDSLDGRYAFAPSPTAAYGVVLVLCSTAYMLLERAIIKCNGPKSKLARAVGSDLKSKISFLVYALAILLAFVRTWIALALYVVIAMIWFIPDRRIESLE